MSLQDEMQPLCGVWSGLVRTQEQDSRAHLLIEFAKGSAESSVLSAAQPEIRAPLKRLVLKDNDLEFVVPDLRVFFSGVVKEGLTEFEGVWEQGGNLLVGCFRRERLSLVKVIESIGKQANVEIDLFNSEMVGQSWYGRLCIREDAQLPLVLRVKESSLKTREAFIDSPAQNCFGIRINCLRAKGSEMMFEVAGLGVRFNGERNALDHCIEGVWQQGGVSFPVVWHPDSSGSRVTKETH